MSWGILLLTLTGAAANTGNFVWLAGAVAVLAIGLIQLRIAGPTQGKLWDSWLTKVIYAYIAFVAIYGCARVAVETGEPLAFAGTALFVAIVFVQTAPLVRDWLRT